jgi:Tfp pilus assembly protein PilN
MRAVNLIPSGERRGGGGVGVGVGRSQGAAYAVLGVIAGLAVLALLYGVARHQISSKRSQLASLQASTQHAHEAASGLSSYTTFESLREQRVKAVSELVESRFDWAKSLHELGRVLPHDASITSLNGTIGSTAGTSSTSSSSSSSSASASVSSATPPGSVPTFTLTGCTTSQAEVALTLQRLRLIEGVTKVALQSSTKSTTTSASSSAGQCPNRRASFSVQLAFAPLPAASASSAPSTQLTSNGGER